MRTRHIPRVVLFVALLGVCLGLVLAARAADAPKEKPKSKPPAEKKAPADKTQWRSLFDGKTLKGWKATQFGGEGKVEIKDGSAILNRGDMMTGITYTAGDCPKMDYELALEGKRVEGNDFFATTTFPVGDTFCSFVIGGWGGPVVGLSTIDFYDASDNPTTKFKQFKTGQWYKFRIRVTNQRIETWIDDEKTVDQRTKGRKVGIRFECDPCKPMGIASYGTTGAVRNIRVRMLTEADKKASAVKPEEE